MHGRIDVRIKWIGFTRNNELSLNRIKIQKKNERKSAFESLNRSDEIEMMKEKQKQFFIIPHQESHTGIYWKKKWHTQRIGVRCNL